MWEEYRYDPLGRRVMVRTRRETPLCNINAETCISSVTRYVWAGDQILWELRDASGMYAGYAGGLVSYTHAGGIDRPLAIWKQGVGSIITHQNWRGQFARGTFPDGRLSDCTEYPPSGGCIPVTWPGYTTTAWHGGVARAPSTGYEYYWMGSLAVGMRDASGQMYMRNRYYDPQTGQFTQMDPIGLAGGLNSYGFANGDPVSFSDPYGLSPCCPWLTGGLSGEEAEQVLRDVNEKLEGVRPTLNTLGTIVISVGPVGGGVLFQSLRAARSGGALALGLAGSSVLNLTSKSAARTALSGMQLTAAQAAAARSAVSRATTNTTIDLIPGGSGSLTVRLTRPGRDGFQVIESTIGPNGNKYVVQKAYDKLGELVHYHPK